MSACWATTVFAPAMEPSSARHKVVTLGFLLGLGLCLNRAALSVLAPAIRRDLNIGPMAIGTVFAAFVWSYALMHVPVGLLGHRFGARLVLSMIVVLWSASTPATAAAWSLISLLEVRFLFGAAEAGATANISHSLARWIPISERARAAGAGTLCAGQSSGCSLRDAIAGDHGQRGREPSRCSLGPAESGQPRLR